MLKKFFFLLFILVQLLVIAEQHKSSFLNLDFESLMSSGRPKYWIFNSEGKNVKIDQRIKFSGDFSLCIEKENMEKQFIVAANRFPTWQARGKKISFCGYIKTENVENGYAGLWCRVDGNVFTKKILGLSNKNGGWPKGTTSWRKYKITVDIPANGVVGVVFGVFLKGKGKVWVDNLNVILDGVQYPQMHNSQIKLNDEYLEWIRTNSIPFSSTDPNADINEFNSLREIVGNRRIVALGEGTHGTSEFFKVKHRLLKFLVKKLGFGGLAIEANMNEVRHINRYIINGKGNLKKLLSGLNNWCLNTEEVMKMIQWIRDYNRFRQKKIQLFGFDAQNPCLAMKSIKNFIKKADKDFIPILSNQLDHIEKAWNLLIDKKDFQKVDFMQWYKSAKYIYGYLLRSRPLYLKSFTPAVVDQIIQDANIILQCVEHYLPGKRKRDQSMAENVDWILKQLPAGTKIVLWGHNNHISKEFESFNSMGYFLSKKYKNDLVTFGFLFDKGEYTAIGNRGLDIYRTSSAEPGTLEWFLKCSKIPNFILNLRGISRGDVGAQWLDQRLEFRSIGAKHMEYAYSKRNVAREFDAIVFLEKTTPSNSFSRLKNQEYQNSKRRYTFDNSEPYGEQSEKSPDFIKMPFPSRKDNKPNYE